MHLWEGNLVSAEEAFQVVVFDFTGRGPAFGRAEDDHRPSRSVNFAVFPGFFLVVQDLLDALLDGASHGLVHLFQIRPSDNVGCPAVALHELDQLVLGYTSEDGRIVDLVAVQVQDRQDRAVCNWVEELVAVPARRQWTSLGLAITHDRQRNGLGVIEDCTKCMADGVSKFTALVNRAWSLWCHVAADATWEGELFEEALQALDVFALVGIRLAVDTLQVEIGDQPGSSVAWSGDDEGIEVILLHHAAEVDVSG